MNQEHQAMLDQIGLQLRTQDNCSTHEPLFVVEQKRRVWGFGPRYSEQYKWLGGEEAEEADEDKARQLDALDDHDLVPDGWERVYYQDTWEFVTACFTRKGCQNYLQANGHNLCEPRIYVHSAYRNVEWINLRSFLIGCGEGESRPEAQTESA